MIKRLLAYISSIAAVLAISSSVALAAAPCPDCASGSLSTKDAIACGTANASGDCSTPGQAADKINPTLQSAINLLSVVGGIVGVVFIIIGGFRYITSGGASDKVTSARNTILYALIGLVVIALSQLIVKFVLNKATG